VRYSRNTLIGNTMRRVIPTARLLRALIFRSISRSAGLSLAFICSLSVVTLARAQNDFAEKAARAERGGPDTTQLTLEVLSYGSSFLVTETGQIADVPDFAVRTAERVARELPTYKVPDIVTALNPSHWPLLRVANPEPALRSIIGKLTAPPGAETVGRDVPTWIDARRQAIRRLNEINPAGARLVLIDELQHFRPTMDLWMTDLLPIEAVPPMDAVLMQKLVEWQRGGAKFRTQIPQLIAKYLSARAASQVKQVFESLQDSSCQPELLAYFVRVEPSYAETFLRNFRWNVSDSMNQCGLLYQSDSPGFGMHPVLENYMIRNLKHEAFGVKWGAAFALRGQGSARALQPLQDAFRSFHDYWTDHKLEQARGADGIEARQLEAIFRSAIAWSRGWVIDEAALRKLAELCITEVCKNAAIADAARWEQKPLRVEISPADSGYGFQGSVVQYRGLQGVEGVAQKLAQFPKGTEFELHVRAAPWDRERITNDLRLFTAQAGIVLK
jgi:hypothetical protein